MKIWTGYGSEHSANLVVIGTFESDEAAQKAEALLNEITRIADADEKEGHLNMEGGNTKFSDRYLHLIAEKNLSVGMTPDDLIHLLTDNSMKVEGNRLVITTEEIEVGAFLKAMIHGGAKIEVYSAHDHPGAYGRGRP